MGKRRMFSLDVVDSDEFHDMPIGSKYLYFNLGLRADDDGFLNNVRRVTRNVGCTENDLEILIQKGFIIQFENGIILISHWRINNLIRNDRYKETMYVPEKKNIYIDEYGIYKISEKGQESKDESVKKNDKEKRRYKILKKSKMTTLIINHSKSGIPSGNHNKKDGIPDDNHIEKCGIPNDNHIENYGITDDNHKNTGIPDDNQQIKYGTPDNETWYHQDNISKVSISKESISKDNIYSSKQGQEDEKIKFLQEDYDAVAKYYESKITLITEESSKVLKYFLTIYDKTVIMYAIDLTVSSGIKKYIYLRAILDNWKRHRIKTLEEAKEYSLAHYNEAKTLSAKDRVNKLVKEGKLHGQ